MNQSQSQVLLEQIRLLESRLNDMSTEIKKRKLKQNQDKQQKSKLLQSHIDSLKNIQKILETTQIEETQWNAFIQLLGTLLQNLDNPTHEAELKQIMSNIQEINKFKIQDLPIFKALEPFDPNVASQQAQLIDQNTVAYKLKMMEISYYDRPQGSDHYPPPTFKEKLNMNSLFPKYKTLPHTIFSNLSQDTLFYVFYFYKEPSEKQLASRELKKHQWLFNPKHNIWLKKERSSVYEETESHIKGSFVYLDFEKWQTKRQNDFKFKKKYLKENYI